MPLKLAHVGLSVFLITSVLWTTVKLPPGDILEMTRKGSDLPKTPSTFGRSAARIETRATPPPDPGGCTSRSLTIVSEPKLFAAAFLLRGRRSGRVVRPPPSAAAFSQSASGSSVSPTSQSSATGLSGFLSSASRTTKRSQVLAREPRKAGSHRSRSVMPAANRGLSESQTT